MLKKGQVSLLWKIVNNQNPSHPLNISKLLKENNGHQGCKEKGSQNAQRTRCWYAGVERKVAYPEGTKEGGGGGELALRISNTAKYNLLHEKAEEKWRSFHSNLYDDELSYELLYEDGQKAFLGLSSSELFSLQRYQEEVEKDFTKSPFSYVPVMTITGQLTKQNALTVMILKKL